jgi:hypothetical protein
MITMSLEKKEAAICDLGGRWPNLMATFKNARDEHIRLPDRVTESQEIKDEWRAYHERHYIELLDLMAELARR